MLLAALLLTLQSAPEKETVQVPGTKVQFEMVKLPGAPGLRSFSIGAKEVRWAEFKPFCDSRRDSRVDGVTRPSDGVDVLPFVGVSETAFEPTRPLSSVRWHSALVYCEWLSKRTGRTFRLPTEKEWEHAARAGDPAAAPAAPDELSWHQGNSGKRNHAVGEKNPNAFGLYDMLGNVWEYCLEFDTPTFAPILRGGSYASAAAGFAARREVPLEWFEADPNRPRSRWWLFGSGAEQGFRVVCVPGAATSEERARVAPKITFRVLGRSNEEVRTETRFVKVKAEVKNGTELPIDELEFRLFFIDPDGGKPVLIDESVHFQPIFTHCWPVLANSRHAAVAAPLQPGGTRIFEVCIHRHMDDFDKEPWKVDATVMSVRFTKE